MERWGGGRYKLRCKLRWLTLAVLTEPVVRFSSSRELLVFLVVARGRLWIEHGIRQVSGGRGKVQRRRTA